MLTSCTATLVLLTLAPGATPQVSSADCACHATNARYNVLTRAKTGYDFVPIVSDDSLGLYVAYSAKRNEDGTNFNSSSCMYVLPLDNDEVLIFGGGFGDTWYLPGGAFFDADYDAAMLLEVITGCLGRDPVTTRVRFVAPHGHPDHVTVAFIKALERAGLTLAEIAYHEGDRAWIEQLPWQAHHPALFDVLPAAACNEEILSYTSPLGRVWFVHRPGHTPGSVDLVLDVLGNPGDRVLILGSALGGCPPPPGVNLTLAAHGSALVAGPRRAQMVVMPGQGTNRMCLSSATPPKLGTVWTADIEVGAHAGATYVFLFGTDCQLNPGLMTAYGEMLVNPLGQAQMRILRPVAGVTESISIAIPNDVSLMGRVCYAQASITGGGIELCNGLRLVIGF